MALLKRLNTDRSLAAFAGQFVPLKLITDGNPEWSAWTRRYRAEGNAIPYLYVVRADGEGLYAKSGPLPGDALPQMLLATLKQSGRTFNDAETTLLISVVEEAKAATAEQNHIATATALSKLKVIGTPGDLKSFSTVAQEADKLAQDVTATGKQNIEAAIEKLNDPTTAFDGVMTLVQGQSAYAGFRELNAQITTTLRDAKRNDALESPLKQAEALVRARTLAASDNALVRKKAPKAYELVITRFPNTPGEKLARAELAAIDPDAEALTTTQPDDPAREFRTWEDATGKHSIEAQFVQQKQGFVQLKKRDGSLVSIQITKLSQDDQKFLAEQ